MANALNANGELINTPLISDVDRAAAKARFNARQLATSWAALKASAQAALIATDHWVLVDYDKPLTDTRKAYREALRAIIRVTPTETPPALPAPPAP